MWFSGVPQTEVKDNGRLWNTIKDSLTLTFEECCTSKLNSPLSIVGHKLIYPGYWLQAANGNGINDGFRGVQVKLSENDAIGFLNSCNNIFGTNFKIR